MYVIFIPIPIPISIPLSTQQITHLTTLRSLDPVPYLDILGLSEGCILVICASLPTLGPLFRLARGKLTTLENSHGPSQQVESASGNHSQRSGRWNNFRGHKLDDVEGASTTGMGSSVDDIPLVSASKKHGYGPGQIHKTVEFGVATEDHK